MITIQVTGKGIDLPLTFILKDFKRCSTQVGDYLLHEKLVNGLEEFFQYVKSMLPESTSTYKEWAVLALEMKLRMEERQENWFGIRDEDIIEVGVDH